MSFVIVMYGCMGLWPSFPNKVYIYFLVFSTFHKRLSFQGNPELQLVEVSALTVSLCISKMF